MRTIRAAALAALLFAPALADAQTVTSLNTLVSGATPPSGFTLQPFSFNCTAGSAACWPLLQIYDGTTRATVNANGGLNTNILGTLPAFAATPTFNLGAGATVAANSAVNVTPNQCDGTIAAGGVAQVAIAAQTTLHGFTITNNDASTGSGEPLWLSTTAAAVMLPGTGSNPLAAPAALTFIGMGSYTTPPGFGVNHPVSVVAATTGHHFGCTWW